MQARWRVAVGLAVSALVTALAPPAAALVVFDWAQIGSPGNPLDTDPDNDNCGPFFNLPCGSVADRYAIGSYEVTNGQYAEFLNAVADDDPNALYSTDMAGATSGITRSGSAGSFSYAAVVGRENKPVNFVSWYDALRFVNWLANGQPSGPQAVGTTETGTYTLTGPASLSGGRAAGARIFLPSEDEWYKAAYFNPVLGVYYDFQTGTDTLPTCAAPTATPNSANCNHAVDNTTDVGSYPGSPSPFGTFDQGGNVHEWTETDIFGNGLAIVRRGGYFDSLATGLDALTRPNNSPSSEVVFIGFRVAAVPEPSTSLLLLGGLLGLAGWRRRRLR